MTLGTGQPFEEAKAIDEILKRTAVDKNGAIDHIRFILILAGMMTETLIEYEEPDAVMEQSFHRISQLLHVTPMPDNLSKESLPSPIQIDLETEIGRELARESAGRLEKGLEEVHEILIAIAYNEFPEFEKEGLPVPECLRIMIEAVIESLIFEMATQEFADVIIEDFISDGWPIPDVLITLGGAAGFYYGLPPHTDKNTAITEIVQIMAREAERNGLPGTVKWSGLDSANDSDDEFLEENIESCNTIFNEFFELVDFNDPCARAVAIAKTGGRMAALVSGPDMNFIQPSLAKVLLKTGLVQGMKLAQE
jgi:hypothetical protein